jgi:hypothetical protein
MDLESRYQKIIADLELGSRALIRFNAEEVNEISALFIQELNQRNYQRIEMVLCLMDHSAVDHKQWELILLDALARDLPPNLLVFSLNCARKHILQARFKRGHRLEYNFLEALKRLLHSPSPEVVEWTLRTIEECGNQGVYFLSEFDKIKPAPWKWFNAHQRAVREIITMLERRWRRFEKH